MDKQKEVKKSFFQKLKLAIFNLERYSEFALEKTSESLRYLICLVLLFSLIASVALTIAGSQFLQESKQILINDLPEFSIKDNQLSTTVNEPKTIQNTKDPDYGMVIDASESISDETLDSYQKKIGLHTVGMIFLKDRILVKSPMNQNQNEFVSYSYQDFLNALQLNELDTQSLHEKIEQIQPISLYSALFLTFLLYMFSTYFIATLFETLLLWVMGYLTCKMANLPLKGKQIYNLTIYALTLPILLNAIYIPVRVLASFNMEYFQMMYTAVSAIYLVTAILLMRTEMLKQQTEIKKIQEVQKQVHEELKQEKQEKNPEEPEKKKETKEEKKDENLGKTGETPEPTE